MRAILLVILLLLSGCKSSTYDLPEEYRPLERIKQSALRSGEFITTIGDTVYVNDLGNWLQDNPVDSPAFKASLRHEQEHSRRQFAYGTTEWVAKYVTDTSFMWEEESIGWYYEITELIRYGEHVSPENVASVLTSYSNLAGRMISYDAALAWVNAVLRGQWKPSPD